MLISLFIFFEMIAIGLFIASFFTKQEILWVITLVISGILMFTSYNIENDVYTYNETISNFQPVTISHSYPYLMGINMIFFVLSLILSMFDIFDKYGKKFIGKHE